MKYLVLVLLLSVYIQIDVPNSYYDEEDPINIQLVPDENEVHVVQNFENAAYLKKAWDTFNKDFPSLTYQLQNDRNEEFNVIVPGTNTTKLITVDKFLLLMRGYNGRSFNELIARKFSQFSILHKKEFAEKIAGIINKWKNDLETNQWMLITFIFDDKPGVNNTVHFNTFLNKKSNGRYDMIFGMIRAPVQEHNQGYMFNVYLSKNGGDFVKQKESEGNKGIYTETLHETLGMMHKVISARFYGFLVKSKYTIPLIPREE